MSEQSNQVPLTVEVVVQNKHGMHLRCCNEVVRIASKFKSKLTISNSRRSSDARSMLGLASLAAVCGSSLVLTADGPDASAALSALQTYFARGSEE